MHWMKMRRRRRSESHWIRHCHCCPDRRSDRLQPVRSCHHPFGAAEARLRAAVAVQV